MHRRLAARHVGLAGASILRIAVALLLLGARVAVQTPVTSYELRYYTAAAAVPFYTQALPPWAYACNQPPVTTTITVNPSMVVWDDPQASGRTCQFRDLWNWALHWFPPGNYEGTLVAINSLGRSPESNRAPFSVGAATATPTHVQIVR